MTGKYKLEYTDAATGESIATKAFPSQNKAYEQVHELIAIKAFTGKLTVLVKPKDDTRWLTYETLSVDSKS